MAIKIVFKQTEKIYVPFSKQTFTSCVKFYKPCLLPLTFKKQNFTVGLVFDDLGIFPLSFRDFNMPNSPYLIDEETNRIVFGEDRILVKKYSAS